MSILAVPAAHNFVVPFSSQGQITRDKRESVLPLGWFRWESQTSPYLPSGESQAANLTSGRAASSQVKRGRHQPHGFTEGNKMNECT